MTDHTTACHDWAQWRCLGCDTTMCRRCDGIPGDGYLCWACFNAEDPETAA